MGKGKKAKQSKNESSVDNVDTSSLNLKQLQNFCERVYKEVVKTELESRSLELERNKLKTMVELSLQELTKVKSNRTEREFDLERTRETIVSDDMESHKQLRNFRNEKSQEILLFLSEANNNLQIMQNDFKECKFNIDQDMTMLKNEMTQLEIDKNNQSMVVLQESEKEKSSLLNTFENDSKLQAAEYERQCSEISLKLKNKYTHEYEAFNDYKSRQIRTYLNENDKLTESLQHYYEKLQQRNMNVLDGLHEEFKNVKDDANLLKNTLKTHKDVVNKYNEELENNNENIKELRDKLVHADRDHKALKETSEKLISLKTNLKNKQWDNLFLEQAVDMSKKENLKKIQEKFKKIFSLQKNVANRISLLECYEEKIRTDLNNMNYIIENKKYTNYKDLSMPKITEIAFAQLEEEAKQQESPKVRRDSDIHASRKRVHTTTSSLIQTERNLYLI